MAALAAVAGWADAGTVVNLQLWQESSVSRFRVAVFETVPDAGTAEHMDGLVLLALSLVRVHPNNANVQAVLNAMDVLASRLGTAGQHPFSEEVNRASLAIFRHVRQVSDRPRVNHLVGMAAMLRAGALARISGRTRIMQHILDRPGHWIRDSDAGEIINAANAVVAGRSSGPVTLAADHCRVPPIRNHVPPRRGGFDRGAGEVGGAVGSGCFGGVE